jgi:hypothetical protein
LGGDSGSSIRIFPLNFSPTGSLAFAFDTRDRHGRFAETPLTDYSDYARSVKRLADAGQSCRAVPFSDTLGLG